MSLVLNLLTEVLNFVTSVGCFEGSGNTDQCPGSVLHPVTAALATQGYWVHADIIWHLRFTNFQTWAILIYLVACIGAICGMAFGAPPKLWIWLLVGPGIFLFLIDTTSPAYGVRWYVGPNSNDIFGGAARDERAMRRVWKLSEVGLANSSVALGSNSNSFIGNLLGLGGDLTVYNDGHPTGTNRTTQAGDPEGTVRVAWLFLWADWVFSDFVEWVVWWTGLFNSGVGAQIGNITRSNLPLQAITATDGLSNLLGSITDNSREDDQAWLLSKNKWSYLMDITGAQLHNGDLRDSFVTMMSSECGDALRRGIDEASYVAAINAKGMNLPASVFKAGTNGGDLYSTAMTELSNTHIPTPPAVAALFDSDGQGSFRKALAFMRDETTAQQWMQSGIMETIACDQLLNIVVEGFRWEAAHIYYQLLTSLPPEMSPLTLMYTLFYGWDMKSPGNGGTLPILGWDYSYFTGADLITPLMTPDDQAEFLQNLIFVHLIRNELQLAPKPFRGRVNEGAKAVQDVNTYQSRTGSRNKYGEVHTWSMMIPYIQGVLLYLMAIAYPFICMMILLPGRSKAMLTWLSFFVWTKLWDIGFAVVMVLERSIWAMLGNGPNTGRVFSRVIDMSTLGDYQVTCPDGGTNPPIGLCNPGTVPDVMVGRDGAPEQTLYMNEIFKYFDAGLTIGGNLQLDLANSYYIYIMSALYFAVPAVTGQMVLGAKAGAAGLASGAVGGLASESGRAAGQGYTAGQSRIAGNNNGMVSFNERNAAMRQAGLAGQALDAGNYALASSLNSQAFSAADGFAGQASRVDNLGLQRTQAQNAQAQGIQQNTMSDALIRDAGANFGIGAVNAAYARNLGNFAVGAGAGALGMYKAASDWGGDSQSAPTTSGASAEDLLGSSSLMRGMQSTPTSGTPSVQSQATPTPTTGGGQQVQNPKPSNTGLNPGTTNNGSIAQTNAAAIVRDQQSNAINGKLQAANAQAQSASLNRQIGWEMAQNTAKLGNTRSAMDNKIWERAQGGMQNYAETQAAMASYGNVRNFQEGTADYLGAIGGNSGVVSGASGNLASQSMTGLAAIGQLGKPNQEKAMLGMGKEVNGQSFFGFSNTVNQQLNDNFGPNAVAAQYNGSQSAYGNISAGQMQKMGSAYQILENPINNAQQKAIQNNNANNQ